MNTLSTSLKPSNTSAGPSIEALTPEKKQRFALGKKFLEERGYGLAQIEFLAGDCSNRTYYRVYEHLDELVLMDAPPPENPKLFCQISEYLQSLGLSAPKIFEQDFDNGFLLIEDFGADTFSKLIKNHQDPYLLYDKALDVILELEHQPLKRPDFIDVYTIDKMVDEALIFMDWYWLKAMEQAGHPVENGGQEHLKAKQSYQAIWRNLIQKACKKLPTTLVLRDFHVDNLMILDRPGLKSCGLLDFQDALWGPIGYDFVSLIQDARLKLHPDLTNYLWERYLQHATIDVDTLQTNIMILSAARHLKILGIFMRMYLRQGRGDYLKFLPHVWNLLQGCFLSPAMRAAKDWMDQYLPAHHPEKMDAILPFLSSMDIIGEKK